MPRTLEHWHQSILASIDPYSRLMNKCVLEKFPRSQHRPSLNATPRFAFSESSMPVKRWNFHKAKWSHYIALTNKFAKTLLTPDSFDVNAAYQDFCNIIKKATKKTITLGYRNNYTPCWDVDCKYLNRTFPAVFSETTRVWLLQLYFQA